MTKHEKFILTPITSILENSIVSCSTLEKGIQSFPIAEYIMQTTFLKLTGFNEQKLKCILWEMATDDFEFRYDFLKQDFSECSTYKDKSAVFNCIKSNIEKVSTFDVDKIKHDLLETCKDKCILLFKESSFKIWFERDYINFNLFLSKIKDNQILVENPKNKNVLIFANKVNLKESEKDNCLLTAFELLYKHRNRCAHNLTSYQENLPSLTALENEDYKYENWFIRFFILLIIDEIFVRMYMQYKKTLD